MKDVKATVGMGMNYTAKAALLRQIASGEKVVVLDPEGEYRQLAKQAAGEVTGDTIKFNQ